MARVLSATLGVMIGVLAAVVGVILCYIESFTENPDWLTVIVGMPPSCSRWA
jgi:hypothetical protein